ncbi:uncharacterized protein LOC128167055 isoform X1 [Crassostrea angulata]|uniref:uncharacterized protein LOC128167055 isoform X1 n=1 Tax=Magallana angulata TaxID=2784310 RepID=UPI0022B10839|nr:uncharacterized protein LOC128167055 isoform X1 [Crassostrea angulata]
MIQRHRHMVQQTNHHLRKAIKSMDKCVTSTTVHGQDKFSMRSAILLLNAVFLASALDTQLNWVWGKAGVSRDGLESDVRNRTTATNRRTLADFVVEKVNRDLHKTEGQMIELVRKKEIKCNNNQLPEVPMAPGIKTKLSKTEKLILVDVLRQINVIKDTIKDAMENKKLPNCLKECKAVSKLFNSGQQEFDISKDFHLCAFMTQYKAYGIIRKLASPPDISVSALVDILLVLTDSAAVTEYLTMAYIKDLQEYEKTVREKTLNASQ